MNADIHLLLLCADCGDERWFEQPPCEDGHGADCPERACVECGAAVLLGPTPPTDWPLTEPPLVSGPFNETWPEPSGGRADTCGSGDDRHRYVA